MEAAAENRVSEFEVCVLVLNYLERAGWKRTASAFKREAKAQLSSASSTLPAGVKTLRQVLNEYVDICEMDKRRQQLQQGNPLAASLYSMLDHHAGLPVPHTLPPAFYTQPQQLGVGLVPQPLAAAPLQLMHSEQAVDTTVTAAGGSMYQTHGFEQPAQQQQQQQQQAVLSPGRHGQRKGAAPRKRRRLQDSLAAAAAAGPAALEGFEAGGSGFGAVGAGDAAAAGAALGAAAPADLLDRELDQDFLASLLEDPSLQAQFAGTLAQSINARMQGHGHAARVHNSQQQQQVQLQHQQQQQLPQQADDALLSGGEQLPAGGLPDLDLDLEELLAELPADPQLAPWLQQVVRAGSRPPSPQASRPGGAEQREAAGAQQAQQEGQAEQPHADQPHADQAYAGASTEQQQQQQQQGKIAVPAATASQGKENVQQASSGKGPMHEASAGPNGQQQQQQQQQAVQQLLSGKRDFQAELREVMGAEGLSIDEVDALIDDDLLGGDD